MGAHCEGPFISKKKKGAHKEEFIRDIESFEEMKKVYGPHMEKNVKIITLAPEKDPEGNVVEECVKRGITVSLGNTNFRS